MHVMVVNNLYPPIIAGGAERIVTYLSEGLVERGHRVSVVSTCGPEMEPYPKEISNGVEVIRFFPPNIYWSHARNRSAGMGKWLWHARDAWNRAAAARMEEILVADKPDVFHTHLIDGFSASIWAAARNLKIPVIHTAHDYHLLCPRAVMLTRDGKICSDPGLACRFFRGWHLRTTRYVDLFTSPSRFLLKMHQDAGLQAERHVVVHNGIPQDRGAHRPVLGPEQRRRFIMLTRLTVEKGVNVVLDAMERLPPSLPIELAIAGTGPLEQKVKDAAAKDPRIKFLGFVDGTAKTELLSQAGVLLLPSLWYENAPVTIIEAAAHGLGILASDLGAIPEFVQPNQTGFLFPPGDSQVLATLMERIVRDPSALPNLGARTASFARQFTLDKMIDTYESYYLSLADRGPIHAAA
jgi:glycosyltransferase involved in cell wall biosynthesis